MESQKNTNCPAQETDSDSEGFCFVESDVHTPESNENVNEENTIVKDSEEYIDASPCDIHTITDLSKNGNNASSQSSTVSLKTRLQNLPEPCLTERIAALDRRLQCSKRKCEAYLQSQYFPKEIEEKDEKEMSPIGSKRRIPIWPELEDMRTRRRANVPLHISNSFHRPTSSSAYSHGFRNNVKENQWNATNQNWRYSDMHWTNTPQRKYTWYNNSKYGAMEDTSDYSRTRNSSHDRRHFYNPQYKYNPQRNSKLSQFKSQFPILPNKVRNIGEYSPRIMQSSARFNHFSSGSEFDSDNNRPISRIVMQQHEKSLARSKISESSFKVGFHLPYIKSRPRSDRNLTIDTRNDLIELSNQLRTCQLTDSSKSESSNSCKIVNNSKATKDYALKYHNAKIKPLYFRENPTSKVSSLVGDTRHLGIQSSLSSPKERIQDSRFNYLDYLGLSGSYTDRPTSSRKMYQMDAREMHYYDRRNISNFGPKLPTTRHPNYKICVPVLDIRSLSNSTDSGETYKINSSIRMKPSINIPLKHEKSSSGSKYFESNRSNSDFEESLSRQQTKILLENQSSTRSNITVAQKPYQSSGSSQLKRSNTYSKIPNRIPSNEKKITSASKSVADSTEYRLLSGRTETSHVSEYESNTMMLFSTVINDPEETRALSKEESDESIAPQISDKVEEQNLKTNEDLKTQQTVESSAANSSLQLSGDWNSNMMRGSLKEEPKCHALKLNNNACQFDENIEKWTPVNDLEFWIMQDEDDKISITSTDENEQSALEISSLKLSSTYEIQNDILQKIDATTETDIVIKKSDVARFVEPCNILVNADELPVKNSENVPELFYNKSFTKSVKKTASQEAVEIDCCDEESKRLEQIHNETKLIKDSKPMTFLVKCGSAEDLVTMDRMDIAKLPISSASTSKLNSLLEFRKETQDRFPFTISESTSRNSSRFRDYDYNMQLISENLGKKIRKPHGLNTHPSIVRLATSEFEQNAYEIINNDSDNCQPKTHFVPKMKCLIQKLSTKLRKSKKNRDKEKSDTPEISYKNFECRNKLMETQSSEDSTNLGMSNELNIPTAKRLDYESMSSGKSVKSMQYEAGSLKLSETNPKEARHDNWVQAFDSKSESSFSQNDIATKLVAKSTCPCPESMINKHESCAETEKSNSARHIKNASNHMPPEQKPTDLEKDFVDTGCICLNWCHF